MLVSRTDPDSRKNTINEINKRAKSGGQWPQVWHCTVILNKNDFYMNLFFVSKGAKLYSVLTQITLKAIFALFYHSARMLFFSFRFLYFQKEHVQIAHVLSRSNKVRYKMYILCSVIISLISISMSDANKKDNNILLCTT